MQSTSTPSRSIRSSRSAGSKRASWSSAAAPRSQGATKTLRADFDQPLAAVHQAQVAGPGAEPVLGLDALAGQVALAVADRLRLARGAGGEHDQRRIVGLEVGRRRGRRVEEALVGHAAASSPAKPAARTVSALRSSATTARGSTASIRMRRSAGAQLLGAGQGDGADPQAGDQREDPLRPVADQGHHHVAATDAPGRERAGQAGRSGRRPRRSAIPCARRRGRSRPGASRSASAASTTSRAKFTCAAGVLVQADLCAVCNAMGPTSLQVPQLKQFFRRVRESAGISASFAARRIRAERGAGEPRWRRATGANLHRTGGAQALSARARQLTPQAYERDVPRRLRHIRSARALRVPSRSPSSRPAAASAQDGRRGGADVRAAAAARQAGEDRRRHRDPAGRRPARVKRRDRGRQPDHRASPTSTAAATALRRAQRLHRRALDKGYDCSGTVSFALFGGRFLKSPLDSRSFMSWGRRGKGRWITVYTNPGHAYVVIAGLRLDTSARRPRRPRGAPRPAAGRAGASTAAQPRGLHRRATPAATEPPAAAVARRSTRAGILRVLR